MVIILRYTNIESLCSISETNVFYVNYTFEKKREEVKSWVTVGLVPCMVLMSPLRSASGHLHILLPLSGSLSSSFG